MQKQRGSKKTLVQTLKFKLVMGSTALVLATVVVLTWVSIGTQRAQIGTQLEARGQTVAKLMAYNARYGVQIGDKPILDKIIGGVMDDPDVVYCLITDKQGKTITDYNPQKVDPDAIKELLSFETDTVLVKEYSNSEGEKVMNIAMPVVLASAAPQDKAQDQLSDLEDDFFGGDVMSEDEGQARETAQPETPEAEGAKRVIGTVQIGITLKNRDSEVFKAARRAIIVGGVIFVVGFFVAFFFGSIISSPIRKVVTLLTDISEGEGDLSQRVHIKAADETGDLATGFNAFMDKFQEIKKISIFLNELADGGGDLTKRLNIASQDEVGMLAKGFDRFTGKLHEIICQVADNTEKIAQASQTVSDTAVRLARDLTEVAQQSGEVAGSSTQISQIIERTNSNVTNVNELMNTTERASTGGVEIVHETRNGMAQISDTIKASSDVVGKLNESSQKIGDTITTITEIADQTKLIAINAAIEASRVGAQGKGFSVVAEEIRRLAARVTKATQEISLRIKAIQEDSSRVVDAMQKGMDQSSRGLELSNRSQQSLENISRSVSDAKSRMNQIAVASNEQSSSIGIISKNINAISGSAKESSEGVSRAAQSMQELNKEVQALRQLVGQFVLER